MVQFRCYIFFLCCLLGACGEAGERDSQQESPGTLNTDSNLEENADTIIGESDSSGDELVFFDAHAHILAGSDEDELIEFLEASPSVESMVVLGPVDTTALQESRGDLFISFAWEDAAAANLDAVIAQLDAGAQGIGEISIRHFPSGPEQLADENEADSEFLMSLYELAEERDVPIHFHFDYSTTYIHELETALSENPDTVFIWDHMGDAQAEDLESLMAQHQNLYLDISSRNSLYERPFPIEDQSITEEDGTLKESWHELFERYPTRVVFGTDIGPPGRLQMIEDVVEYYRSALEQLSPETAANIAGGNMKRLLNIQ